MILGQRALVRRRYAAGARGADGRFEPGASTDTPIYGSLQPADGDDLQTLAEGERARRARKLYTKTELRVLDVEGGLPADEVLDGDTVWTVRLVGRETAVLPHYKALLLAPLEGE